ncbi:helix-turn-helix domain-containing protein [Dactylosporangium sp. AC04546]|uniref:TetR/AcrR family transcriptional regulator n=1 Tax=Dactylosporangium sp. AC04546 TaxID=2862460 RepID=UPI001EE11BEB|nr:helix-turn-helix domain-containing protein [Dactylosporangium sp. AC04546]WVK88185.1 helix-turn-helix domain-containing protein [Dactylosporangium sp. AC04546]
MRADAARNRSAILAAARQLIAARGPGVGMDELAAAAGVAVGTLYRHFPAKEDLVRAIVADLAATVGEVLDAGLAEVRAGRRTAHGELAALFHRVVVEMGQERLLREALASREALEAIQRQAMEALTEIVAAGHADGSLAPDVTVGDVALLLRSAPDAQAPRPERERWVELACRALRRADA